MFFGGGERTYRSRRGADLSYNLEITLEEVAFGTEKQVNLQRYEKCTKCNGTGGEPGSEIKTCSTCNGTGQVRHIHSAGFSQIVRIETCRRD